MKTKRVSSIQSNLVRLVAACLVPAFLMAVALLYLYYERESSELVRQSANKARAISFAVGRELVGIETVLLAMAGSSNLLAGDLEAFDPQAREIVRGQRIANILLVDLHGQQLINTRSKPGEPLGMHGDPELVKNVVATKRPVISGLFIGTVTKRPLVSVGVPVLHGDEVLYVLTASILPERIGEIFIQQQVDDEEAVGVLDGTGTVVARSQDGEANIGLVASRLVTDAIKVSEQGVVAFTTADGDGAQFVYNRSPRTGWTSYIILTDERLRRNFWRTLGLLMAATAMSLAAALGMAWVIGRHITRTIKALGPPALALGSGKPLAVPHLPILEVNDVGQAIVKASEILNVATSALRSGEARMRAILESAMDAIITLDDQQTIVLFNLAAARVFECPAEQAIGSPITRFIPERFHARHHDYVGKSRERTEVLGEPKIAAGLRHGHEEFPVEVSYSHVVESGAMFHTLIIRDVTARERALAALERSNQDLQQFAYVASHDLKTPLRSISGFVQVLAKNYADKLDEKAALLIQRTQDAARRLEQLTDDLLLYARISSEAKPFARVDCAEVVQEVIQLLDAAINSSGAVITVGKLPSLPGDRTQLVQLFLNLISNGIKYCRDRTPVIHVSAVQDDQSWIFSVQDNGIGIDSKHHSRIFEVFKRLHTQQEYPGTGIGLSVCRRVVDRHRGKLWLTSVVGQGSTFKFSIPKATVEDLST